MTGKTFQLNSVVPVLPVPDVVAAVEFYKTVLGFPHGWTWGEPPEYAGVHWDKVAFQFSLKTDLSPDAPRNSYAVNVSGIEALFERHTAKSVDVVEPLQTHPWGMKEYTIRDINGYHLRFGEPANIKEKAESGLPNDFRLERQKPPLADYERLIRAVGWESFSNFEVMPVTWNNVIAGVTAYDGDAVIGCALLNGDNASFFYVRDVMVQPEYQGRGVGTAVMTELMKLVREVAPDRSFVTLFTGGSLPDFYEKFGFRGTESLYGMSMILRKENGP